MKVAEPYFEWRAATAVQASQLNVVNHSGWLLRRYRFLRQQFDNASAEAERRREDRIVTTSRMPGGGTVTSSEWPYRDLRQNAKWLGLAAIEAFFSWTEHVFIQLAILQGKVTTGDRVAELAEADWQEKFKAALDVTDRQTKAHFDKLVVIRRQMRNFVSHGAFGKQGQAFRFHSGAVPFLYCSAADLERDSSRWRVKLRWRRAPRCRRLMHSSIICGRVRDRRPASI